MATAQSDGGTEVLDALVAACALAGIGLFVLQSVGLAVFCWLLGCGFVIANGGPSDGSGDVPAVDPPADRAHRESSPPAVDESARRGPRDRRNADRDPIDSDGGTPGDALDALRERYARGDLTERQFERRVERLLSTEAGDDALRTLRRRYAAGDLSDEQFERKLERLTRTRTLEDATDAYRGGDGAGADASERATEE